MRRISVLLAVAAVLLTVVVGVTLVARLAQARRAHAEKTPEIKPGLDARAMEWNYAKSDDKTGRPIVRLHAKSFQATHDPSTSELHDLSLRLYSVDGGSYTYVQSDKALFDDRTGLMKSEGAVQIVMNVPSDKDAADKTEAAKRVQVTTSGVIYETKTGKASTDQPASFLFTEGDGKCVGAEYDPNTKLLHLKSQVALDWIGKGPAENKIHIETSDLIYKEAEQKIYMTPWSKMQRQGTTINAQNTVVTIQDGYLQHIDGDKPSGVDDRDDRRTEYSADKMTALFDDSGNLVNIVGQDNAKVVAAQLAAQTSITGNRADLRFAVTTTQVDGQTVNSSDLHLVLADGHAVAESSPIPQPGVQLTETRILRSEHIELEMKPDGKDVQEIRTSSQAQLEFKPNRPDQSHRVVDASHVRVVYGESSYIDTFLAWNVATHTDKPAAAPVKSGSGPPAPALTWSDQMVTKFQPNSNQVASIDQSGNFRYQEGVRQAWAKKARLEQNINRITLIDSARVLDNTGSAIGDTIVMNQTNGDMDASGHVVSTHQPDKNEKPGTSMLDASQAMQAQADKMVTRENNSKVQYTGHAVMWQGANRISADIIDIDRDSQSLHAVGNVVSELVDSKQSDAAKTTAPAKTSVPAQTQASAAPVFTVVRAPELSYRDDTRIATYTDAVTLTRDKMTITAKQLMAYLTPKSDNGSDQSSLDHAVATGNVKIFDVLAAKRTRTGSGEHCEYYTKTNKVVLNGGSPQMIDSYKGVTKGQQLTYYDDDDRLIVEGEKKQLAYTTMKKK